MTSKKAYITSVVLASALFGTVIGFNEFKEHKMMEHFANMKAPPAPVVTLSITTEDWTPMINTIGFIEPLQSLNVAMAASGTVSAIHFDSGSSVSYREPLIELDSEVEKASLEVYKSQLPALLSNYERDLELAKRSLISPAQLEASESQMLAMKANIKVAKETLKRRMISAPFSGVMGLRDLHVGEYINAGVTLASLENITDMKVRFSLPQKQISQVANGDTTVITVDAYPDLQFSGKISAITPRVEKSSGLIELEATIPNADGLLRSGMFASVSVEQPTIKNAVAIPQDAIAFTMYSETVFVVSGEEDNLTVENRSVNVIERRGDVALVENLEEGEQIVVAGQVGISNGSSVFITEENFEKSQNRSRG
ncbi:Efflux transporter periplasmic adaptor subunit [Vibrio chagasii]|nr:Efflux transporter periplasmic adaptor subunit [Vibrio chagasii]